MQSTLRRASATREMSRTSVASGHAAASAAVSAIPLCPTAMGMAGSETRARKEAAEGGTEALNVVQALCRRRLADSVMVLPTGRMSMISSRAEAGTFKARSIFTLTPSSPRLAGPGSDELTLEKRATASWMPVLSAAAQAELVLWKLAAQAEEVIGVECVAMTSADDGGGEAGGGGGAGGGGEGGGEAGGGKGGGGAAGGGGEGVGEAGGDKGGGGGGGKGAGTAGGE